VLVISTIIPMKCGSVNLKIFNMNTKNKFSYYLLLFFLLCGGFFACDKNELRLTEYDLPQDKAYIRFALFSPGTPSTMIKVNDVKINGATTSGNGGFFPSIVNSPDYSAITPNGNFRLSLPNTGTGNDSVLLYSGTLAVEAKKFYSVCLADTGISRTLFAIEDKLGALPDSGYVNIRLINAQPKLEALNLIRIDSTSSTVVVRDTIARNIAYKSATDYIKTSISPLPLPTPPGNYSFLRFRVVTASGLTVGSVSLPTSPTPNQRSMTAYAFGFSNGTGVYAPGVVGFIYNQ